MALARRIGRLEGRTAACAQGTSPPLAEILGPDAHPLWEMSREERVAACRDDRVLFAQVYLAHRLTAPVAAFHHELLALVADTEQEPGAGAIIAAPRGHAKITWVSFVEPLHALLYQRKRCVVLLSNTAFLAVALVRAIRQELEANPLIRRDFGDLRGAKWTDADCETTTGAKLVARSMGAQLRGISHFGQRPDLIIADDLENDDHVRTPEQRAKALDWFNKVVLPTMDPQRGNVIVVGTVLHYDSLLMKLLQQEEVYRTRIYRTDEQQPLWPEWMGAAKLAFERRRAGSLAFNSEYRNDPIDPETQIFRPAWWRWYTREDVRRDSATGLWLFRDQPLVLYQGVDPAISLKESADYFAHVTLGVSPAGDVLVLDVVQDRLDFPAQVDLVVDRYERWRPRLIGLEVTAYQRALRDQVLSRGALPIRELTNAVPVSAGYGPAGLPTEVGGHARPLRIAGTAKEMRLISRSALVENGQVWLREALPDEAGEVRAELDGRRVHHLLVPFFVEATQYPRSAHDDLLDAFDNALQVAQTAGTPWGQAYFALGGSAA